MPLNYKRCLLSLFLLSFLRLLVTIILCNHAVLQRHYSHSCSSSLTRPCTEHFSVRSDSEGFSSVRRMP